MMRTVPHHYSLDHAAAEHEIVKWSGHLGRKTGDLDQTDILARQFGEALTNASRQQQVPLVRPDRGDLLPVLQPQDLRDVAATFPWKTCTGVDIHPRHVSLISATGLHWLSMLYATAEAIHELPDVVKLILFFTRPKPTGREANSRQPPVVLPRLYVGSDR